MTNTPDEPHQEEIEHAARRLIDEEILANQTMLVDDLTRGELLDGFPADWIATEDPVYEWWLVTQSLARELERSGELVVDNDYGRWWGRKATGQAIRLDGLFQRIAANQLARML